MHVANIYHEYKIFKTDAGELEGGSVSGGHHNFISLRVPRGQNMDLLVIYIKILLDCTCHVSYWLVLIYICHLLVHVFILFSKMEGVCDQILI